MESSRPPITVEDVEQAARRLEGQAVRTPLISSGELDDRLGVEVVIKPESLQRTGSFKFRGAYTKISSLDQADRDRGVVAFSSGNHAQGVACAAALLGWPATIVMPADAPPLKISRTRGYGAEVVLYDRASQSREVIAAELVERTGAILVPPFDDPLVMAGQGTVGLELCEQAAERGVRLDAVLVPCGGGGLTAGVATAVADRSPATAVYCVEPATMDDTARSLETGRRVPNPPGAETICDALRAEIPGELTFAVNRPILAGGLRADDEEVRAAMRWAFENLKLVAEPGGAVALAAVLHGRLEPLELPARPKIAVVVSGGNADPQQFADILRSRT